MKAKCCLNQKLTREYSNLARFLRIIGDDNRLRILYLLEKGEKCVCEISPQLGLAQNLTSSHLKVLLDFKLLTVRRDWKKNFYAINQKTFKKYNLLLSNLLKKYE